MKIFSWIAKRDIIIIILLVLAFCVFVSQLNIDPLNKSIYTVLAIPIFLYLLKVVIEHRIKGADAEIDMWGSDINEKCIVWKEDNKKIYPGFIVIKNRGSVIIQKVLVKVLKEYNGGEYNGEVNRVLYPGDEIIIGVPFEFSEIESIWVSGFLKYEKITKQFYGDISEYKGKHIWAEENYFFGEKHYLKNKEKKGSNFVRLKKYWY